MNTIHIEASRKYDVLIGSGLMAEAGRHICGATGSKRALIVSDDAVFPIYGEKLRRSLTDAGLDVSEFIFPHGERSKTLDTYIALLNRLSSERLTRSDAVVALGGGVVGDLAGFAASTYKRGMSFVQVPTTLLAAVDSSVGGKTAVDLGSAKNQVGSFYQPSAVVCDTDVFSTLPREQYLCGCAEVIKYGVIGSEAFFDELIDTPVSAQTEHVVSTCVAMKRDYVVDDEYDTGSRIMLNFGHTLGHAAEACSDFSILHGQGVAMGMAAITRAACKRGVCSEKTLDRLLTILEKYGFETGIPYSADDMLSALMSDKKRAGDKIKLVVPERIGKTRVETVPIEAMRLWLADGGIE